MRRVSLGFELEENPNPNSNFKNQQIQTHLFETRQTQTQLSLLKTQKNSNSFEFAHPWWRSIKLASLRFEYIECNKIQESKRRIPYAKQKSQFATINVCWMFFDPGKIRLVRHMDSRGLNYSYAWNLILKLTWYDNWYDGTKDHYFNRTILDGTDGMILIELKQNKKKLMVFSTWKFKIIRMTPYLRVFEITDW